MDWRRWKQESKGGPLRGLGAGGQSGAQPRGSPGPGWSPPSALPYPGAALTAVSWPAAHPPSPGSLFKAWGCCLFQGKQRRKNGRK